MDIEDTPLDEKEPDQSWSGSVAMVGCCEGNGVELEVPRQMGIL